MLARRRLSSGLLVGANLHVQAEETELTGTLFRDYATAFDLPATPSDLGFSVVWESPYEALRGTTDIATMRSQGTFFTGPALAAAVWATDISSLTDGSVVFDPAAGAGDLLLPAADLARAKGFNLVLRINDIEETFLRIAKTRLSTSGGPTVNVEASQLDFLLGESSLDEVTHVVLNPPYIAVTADVEWASGKVNAAGVFVTEALSKMQPGAVLLALLPDVLRSGSRYSKWREKVESLGRVTEVQIYGVFDDETDVHVFLLRVVAGKTSAPFKWSGASVDRTLGDLCDVRVGPVVPHRDPAVGPVVPFVTARNLTSGIKEVRPFSGRLEHGPMVLVNRTSRPGEMPRVRARVREETDPAAVENHLLVVTPRSHTSLTTRDILRVLGSARTAEFLDERIRCRHLTVTALKEIPWSN